MSDPNEHSQIAYAARRYAERRRALGTNMSASDAVRLVVAGRDAQLADEVGEAAVARAARELVTIMAAAAAPLPLDRARRFLVEDVSRRLSSAPALAAAEAIAAMLSDARSIAPAVAPYVANRTRGRVGAAADRGVAVDDALRSLLPLVAAVSFSEVEAGGSPLPAPFAVDAAADARLVAEVGEPALARASRELGAVLLESGTALTPAEARRRLVETVTAHQKGRSASSLSAALAAVLADARVVVAQLRAPRADLTTVPPRIDAFDVSLFAEAEAEPRAVAAAALAYQAKCSRVGLAVSTSDAVRHVTRRQR